MALHNEFGRWGEQVAEEYLQSKGYIILERDWQYDHSDIDILACIDDSDTLVSVEVKTRKNEDFVSAISAVTERKEKKIVRTTFAYVKHCGRFFKSVRFDIITVVGTRDDYELTHYEDMIHPYRWGGRR